MSATPATPHGVPQAEWDTAYAAALLGEQLAADMRAIARDADAAMLWPRVRATLERLRALLVLVTVVAATLIMLSDADLAQASARHVRGTCGMHKRSVVFPFKHRWRVRIGVKPHRVGGSHRCHGIYRPSSRRRR